MRQAARNASPLNHRPSPPSTVPSTPAAMLGLDRATLEEVTRLVRLSRGMALPPADAELYLIESGQVLVRRELPSGRQALDLLGPGDLFGEGALSESPAPAETALVLANGAARALPVANIPRLAVYYPASIFRLLSLLGARVARAESLGAIRTVDQAADRLLEFLREMGRRFGDPYGEETWVPLQLTQSDLAEILGLARETVVRVQSRLEAEGKVRREGRRGFWLRGGVPGRGADGAGELPAGAAEGTRRAVHTVRSPC